MVGYSILVLLVTDCDHNPCMHGSCMNSLLDTVARANKDTRDLNVINVSSKVSLLTISSKEKYSFIFFLNETYTEVDEVMQMLLSI